MTAGFCDNDDCLEGWHWTQLGEFPEPCPEQVVEEPPGADGPSRQQPRVETQD